MSVNTSWDIYDPQINLKREAAKEHDCRLLEIKTPEGNILVLHFAGDSEMKAFVGLCNIAVGNKHGN